MAAEAAPARPEHPKAVTRIVGIGASAGGLSALEQFIDNIPAHSGLAYVVVQHMDPTQPAMLANLLQRVSDLPVREVHDGMLVEPDRVYVIPPNTELRVRDDRLCLELPTEPRGLRLPINVLFSSLAGAQGERAIAVTLSGMGSDGTLGMQAVKAVGGLNVVQRPDSAQFDSMPSSAIAAGCADIVATPAELPDRILAYIAKVPEPGAEQGKSEPAAAKSEPFVSIVALLRQRTGHDFSLYKRSTLHRRIERRMAIHQVTSMAEYDDLLGQRPQEIDLLFKELLIGVTSFFRDSAVWKHLADVALPELLTRQSDRNHLRAWVVGCSTGEEAYSLAMVFKETTERFTEFRRHSLQVFASDLSSDAIAIARRGRYPVSVSADVSQTRLGRFFEHHETYYQVQQEIRDMVLFAHHDVVLDPPFTKLDLISCRNLLIYFDAQLQHRLVPLFHYSLNPGGVLVLGSNETVGKLGRLFSSIDPKFRIYLRQDNGTSTGPQLLMRTFPPLTDSTKESTVPTSDKPNDKSDILSVLAEKLLLQRFSPPAVAVNSGGDIVYISGHTGNYLEPAVGKANLNIYAMVRDDLRAPIVRAMEVAATQDDPIHLTGLQARLPAGLQFVDVTVQALREPAALSGLTIIVFKDSSPQTTEPRRRHRKGTQDQTDAEEVQSYKREIQALRDESRASHEELQTINEELQSTNEELQSANEELTTSREEMQSMNEELQTINAELQTKLDDLALAQSDMQNLLNSIEIAILFLDRSLNVRRYTDRAAKIINLRESDIGRPLSDLTTTLQYPELNDDALETLRTLEISEKQILTDDGRWFSVRILPYRRVDDLIDGVVITLVDISDAKRLESELRRDSNP
jgi:two-component system, chemotaxis family, CheB/CheR fusion protein